MAWDNPLVEPSADEINPSLVLFFPLGCNGTRRECGAVVVAPANLPIVSGLGSPLSLLEGDYIDPGFIAEVSANALDSESERIVGQMAVPVGVDGFECPNRAPMVGRLNPAPARGEKCTGKT